jgi:hypothetical protein
MKNIFSFLLFILSAVNVFAQKEVFDIVSYTPPEGWKKEIAETLITYTIINKQTNTWCRINIVKSDASKGSIEQDFDSEWQELVVKNYKPTEAPQLNEVKEADGWKIKTGIGKFIFSNTDAIAMLTTTSGFNRRASIIAVTNSKDYIKDIEAFLLSVNLIKPKTDSQQTSTVNDDNAQLPSENSIIGTWGISLVVPYRNGTEGTAGSNVKQYTFNNDGTYNFYIKTFRYSYDKLLLTRENGIYQINGNKLTIIPQKNVIESWSKKDGTDKWGKLISTQNKTLEKTTYQYTKSYSSGVQQWNLVLQSNKATERDGSYNGGSSFTNAWIYSPVTCKECFIKLPD